MTSHRFPAQFTSRETTPRRRHFFFFAFPNFKKNSFYSSEIETKSNISFFLNEIQKWLRIEWTKKSIEQLSTVCEENCTKVRREFDKFREETRLKAEELCDQMKEKTSEKERKWRQSIEEKERLSLSDDDEEIFSGVRSLGAEFSGRLYESFPPVEEGHFVVTFPEWCQRSLEQLEEEIVDFKVKTWHPRELELESEFRLRGSNLGWIRSITASDIDGHVFVVDWGDKSIKEFGETGEFVGRYSPPPPASKFHSSPSLKLFFSLSFLHPRLFPSLYICLCFSMPSNFCFLSPSLFLSFLDFLSPPTLSVSLSLSLLSLFFDIRRKATNWKLNS
ncbi:unnamed protein product [Acanthosepion pharaonis]|uniref:Uncharacterized protein n=1 Tax=Acanthosepion pharaonis TaxID=158019 RepID=A0A812CE05_ACAPH|nr:unnamed protein product [Sepia pharaonis]